MLDDVFGWINLSCLFNKKIVRFITLCILQSLGVNFLCSVFHKKQTTKMLFFEQIEEFETKEKQTKGLWSNDAFHQLNIMLSKASIEY